MLSDFAIAPVGENILRSSNYKKRDAILIARDLVAGDNDDEDDEEVTIDPSHNIIQ